VFQPGSPATINLTLYQNLRRPFAGRETVASAGPACGLSWCRPIGASAWVESPGRLFGVLGTVDIAGG
jgi:hypothetical protein